MLIRFLLIWLFLLGTVSVLLALTIGAQRVARAAGSRWRTRGADPRPSAQRGEPLVSRT